MNISNDGTANIDPVQYVTKQFPQEFAQYIAVRDELARRQGAMSAVEDSLKDRAKAKDELAKAEAEAAAMVNDAQETNAKSKAQMLDELVG